ncbi:acyl-CoA dehydrogenase family protein [Streptomyces sp. NPDC002851]
MDFQLNDDQRALRAGVRELLEGRFGREALRALADAREPVLDRELWRELGEAGFFALRLPEAQGGVGLGLPEAVLAFEEAGRVLLPGPLVATHLAAGAVEGAATGETVVTDVYGTLVPWLDAADVVRADASGAVPVRSVDPLTPLHRVQSQPVRRLRTSPSPKLSASFEQGGTPLGRKGGLGAQPPGAATEPTVRVGGAGPEPVARLLFAAEQLGSAARTCEMAVRYAREREQFGRPIGAFQAVKHLCAQLLVRAELARSAVYAAAVTGDPVEIAGAGLLADEAAVRNARDCLQVHGGIGFTWEADVHLHLKRAWVRAELAGSAAAAEEELAAAL